MFPEKWRSCLYPDWITGKFTSLKNHQKCTQTSSYFLLMHPFTSHLHPIYIPFTSHLHPIYIPFTFHRIYYGVLWRLNTHSSWSTPHSIDRGFSSPSVVGWRPNLSVKIRLNLLDTSIYMWDMYRYVSCTSLLGYFETYTNIASVSWINLFLSWDFSWFFINHSWPSPEDGSIGWYCVLLSMTW